MRRFIAVIASLVTFGSIVLVATPAHAAWYCGNTCNDTDPANFLIVPKVVNGYFTWGYCADDAQTVRQVYHASHDITLQLRYSRACRTVWGRIFNGRYQNYYIHLRQVYRNGYFEYRGEIREIPYYRPYNWGFQYNDANVTIEACVSQTWSRESIIGGEENGCTGAY